MPKLNGTGPDGNGSNSGRKLGLCDETNEDRDEERMGKGLGKGRKSSKGSGQGKRRKSGLIENKK